ncbi:MAG: hypothetical protein WCO26_08890 [Deltaproteobacteria bacterium]
MDSKIPRGFFAYPSTPATIPEAVSTATKEVNRSQLVLIKTWEKCRVGGKLIMQEICKEIDVSDLFCADLTGINANVMFELGYAIARNKRIWLILDPTLTESRNEFNQLKLLTTIGYAEYINSHDIAKSFYKDRPYEDLLETILEKSIKPNLSPIQDQIILYLKSRHDTEASNRLTKRIQTSNIRLIIDDPKESAVQTLSWYGQKAYSSIGVFCHFTSPAREGARLHNARYALVSGLAYGFTKPLLMLTEGDYLAPVDYRELLMCYGTAAVGTQKLDEWLKPLEESYGQQKHSRDEYARALKLATELKGFQLQLGEHVAENEGEKLIEEYFVETTPFREALEGRQTIFIGRKGTGKTANLLKLAATLQKDLDNLVCVIKPVAYEIEGLLRLFSSYHERDTKGYVIESLWKFLLYTEMANSVLNEIEHHPYIWLNETTKPLIMLLDESQNALKGDFAVRLERCVEALLVVKSYESIEQSRKGISEALHESTLKRLRIALGDALGKKKRVAILVDNLDKAWTKEADLGQLSEFLLGLLSVAGRISNEFKRSDSRKQSVNVSLAIFLRSDIFNKVLEVAREPDKLNPTRLIWDDPELLFRIIEERYVSSHGSSVKPSEMWDRYFSTKVRGIEIKDYIAKRILPRPRDIVLFVKNAVSTAINRSHTRVEEKDILDAERQYSQYAIDSIMVENGITLPELESILFEFAGCNHVLNEKELKDLILKARVPEGKLTQIIDHLINLSFLGLEIDEGEFTFSDDPKDYLKNNVLAERLVEGSGRVRRYKINPAFCAYLEIKEEQK